MVDIHRVGDLEINEDLNYQQKMWKIERVGWCLMGLTVIAGILGLFGSGLLSYTIQGKNEPLKLKYERFGRYQSPTELQVHLAKTVQQGETTRVAISRKYLEQVQIQEVSPEPDTVEAQPEQIVYHFRVNSIDQPTAITFFLEPEAFGPISGTVQLDQGQTQQINQFIYP